MAGHSKWANIKHRKERQDAKKGKIFTKLIRELTVAARQGGGLVADNPRLRLAQDKALGANMTRDTIDRAIARGAGSADDDKVEELSYEGYGPGGVAIMVETMTDNRNRTAAEVRHAFTKCGGNLGTDGSVAYLFERKGQLSFAAGVNEEALMDAAMEADADDVQVNDDASIDVFTTFASFYAVRSALEADGFKAADAEFVMLPTTSALLDLDTAQKVLKLIDMLEDLDDVQNLYSNAEIPDEILEQLV
ncbi:MAG: YebC/PmpR family DNA-binding transcriptional regulator [Pseudomonas sp.]